MTQACPCRDPLALDSRKTRTDLSKSRQTVSVATSQAIRNLQAYIYKRPGDADFHQVCTRVQEVDSRDKLTAAQRDALLVPVCSRPDAELLQWLIDYGSRPQKQLKKLLTMTVGWNERRLEWAERQIAVLQLLRTFVADGEDHLLSEALSTVCWFGNTGPAVWLIETGADTHFSSWNALGQNHVDCLANAEMRGERLGDYSTYEFLRPWHESREPLTDWKQLYEAGSNLT